MRPPLLNLRSKMALSFGALCAVILVLVSLFRTFGLPWTSDQGSYGEEQALISRQLRLLADLNKERLRLWLGEREGDAAALAQSEIVVSSTRKLVEITQRAADQGLTRDQLCADLTKQISGEALMKAIQAVSKTNKAYRKIQVADAQEGLVIASTENRELGAPLSQQQLLAEALDRVGKASVIVARSPATSKPFVAISSAIQDKPSPEGGGSAKTIAVVIMYVDEDQLFRPLLYSGSSIGKTGDIVLVTQDLEVLNTRNYPRSKGTHAAPLGYRIDAEPARLAAQGKESLIVSRDYRGVQVLAAYRHIETARGYGLGLVVKVDRDEMFAPTRRRLIHASLISLLGVLAASVVAALIAGRIARPIQDLSLVAQQVEAGNFDARALVVRSDEIGNLAFTFNSMIERIGNWHKSLEEQVEKRTLRLTELNEELIREVAERKRADERIRTQNDFLETILESLSHPFYVIDVRDYRILMANPAATRGPISGASTCYALTHGRREPCFGRNHPCPLDDVRMTEQPVIVEHVHYDKDGGARNVEVHAYPIFDAEGTVSQVIEYTLDVTDRKEAEKERERLIAELESKNAELERFTYTVSHDLKSPLITIKGFLGYLERDVASGNFKRVRTDSERIQGAVEKMSRLLEELLELSRIGRIMNPPQEVSLNEIVREAVELLAGRIAERGVTLDIAEDLPVLHGDPARLREVVENLLDNAVKFMGKERYPRVEIGVRRSDDSTVIYVKDNGTGVDARYHDKVFGLFERLETNTEGTGIGLAIVKRIVEVHGGRIWVESDGVGNGCTFCFTLPKRSENISA